MERYYIIDNSKPFKGHVENTARMIDGIIWADYSQKTFDEYKKDKGNENLTLITERELEPMLKQYVDSLKTEWKETTKDEWWDLYECLPPYKLNFFEGGQFSFISEADFASIHCCIAKYNNKYYTSKRCVFEKAEDIINSIKHLEP